MKFINYVSALVFLFINANLFAQTGNVGIGTTTPQYKLEVNGSAKIATTPTITTATKMLVKDPSTGQISEQSIALSSSSRGLTTNTITATTTAPVKGTVSNDINAWTTSNDLVTINVVLDVRSGATGGSGDYILTLPNGYSFDTNLYQTNNSSSLEFNIKSLIGASGAALVLGVAKVLSWE